MSGIDDTSLIRQVLPIFQAEAMERLATLEDCLLRLEEQPGDRELLDELFRCAHTIKGSAGIFGFDAMVELTHHLETLLDQVRAGEVAMSAELGTLLLQCCDALRHLLQRAVADDGGQDEEGSLRQSLINRLQGHMVLAREQRSLRVATPVPSAAPAAVSPTAEVAAADPARQRAQRYRIAVVFGGHTLREGMNPLAILGYLDTLGELGEVSFDLERVPRLDQLDPEQCHLAWSATLLSTAARSDIEAAFSFVMDDSDVSIEPIDAAQAGAASLERLELPLRDSARPATTASAAATALAAPSGAPGAAAAVAAVAQQRPMAVESRFLKVQADRLDHLINVLGELVVASASAELQARLTRHYDLMEVNHGMAQLIEVIRDGLLQMRMVPIGDTFSRFRRVVRDTAAQLGKDVAFDHFGGDTELDKSVVERVTDPLMHIVRNALDHGLETPQEREAAGKPPQGYLRLRASHEAGHVLIDIEDDGRGIQRAKVLKRARERGLIDHQAHLTDAEILRLIFAPGFSTAETVTNLSGRGVGLDVVRSNIEALRGHVSLHSVEGQGARFSIRLPLTLAIIDGFLMGVGNSRFIIALDSVVEVIKGVEPGCWPAGVKVASVALRDGLLPVIDLRMLYGMPGEPDMQKTHAASPGAAARAAPRSSIVVVRAAVGLYGVVVDMLLGQHQTVIKPMGKLFRSLPFLSGSTILGNGEVALILDVHALGDRAVRDGETALGLRPGLPLAGSATILEAAGAEMAAPLAH